MAEARSTVLNPKYIKEMMKEGAAATGSFTEVFRNTLGWEIMKPDLLEDHLWQAYKETYVDDKLKLNMREFFEKNNPAALQEMTGIMLEAVRKDFWKADAETVKQIARTHAELMKKFDLPPTRNEKLREMIRKNLQDPELRRTYERQIARMQERQRRESAARKKADEVTGRKLKAQTVEPQQPEKDRNRSALLIIAGIVILALLAVILGNRRKKNVL